MTIDTIAISDIKPYEKNAKSHPKKQVDLLAENITRFGFTTPLLVDKDNNLIAGHGRLEAVKTLGWTDVPCVRMENLTEDEVKALRLADNKLAEMSEWDMTLVLEDLKELDDDLLDLTGFDKDLIIEPDEADDEVPDVPEEPQSKLGDLYELGNHRVLCGDSTKLEDVERLMDGKKADMVFTDPPYNALKSWKKDEAKGETRLDPSGWFANDNMSWEEFDIFLTKAFEGFSGHSIYVCCDYRIYPIIRKHIETTPYEEKHCIVWKKNVFGLGKRYRFQHEFIVYATKPAAPFLGGNGEGDVWEVSVDRSREHKTPKPVELPARAVKNSCNHGDIVQDLFLGSGTTLIASEKTGRICYGMELDPKYIDVIIQRYVDYTGNATIKKNGEEIVWKTAKKQQES